MNMMLENKTEVEIILKNGKSIVMHCENYTVTTNAFGGYNRLQIQQG